MDSSLANKIELEHPVEESSTENKQLPSSTSNIDTTQNMQSTWNAPPAYTHANTSNTNSAQNNYNPMMAGNSTNAGFVNNQKLQELPAADYTAWSVINTFCCCFLFGVIAWAYSCQTSSANSSRRYAEAKEKSMLSRGFNIAATVIGVIAIIAIVLLKANLNGY